MAAQYGIEGKIEHIAPTENVRIEVKDSYEDFCYRMENGDLHHFEFESDSITMDDLLHFREYEAVTSRNFRSPVITHVLCSSNVQKPMDHIDVGINTYRVLIHRHKDQNADLLISDLKGKDPDTILRADLAALMFTPLMSGLTTQKERVLESAKLLQQEYPAVPGEDRKKMLAVLYVLATKFLTVEEMNEVKEVFSMNPLGKMIFDEVV